MKSNHSSPNEQNEQEKISESLNPFLDASFFNPARFNNHKLKGGIKMNREKIELKASLKAQDYSEGQVIKPTAFIKEIVDVETKFGDKTIIKLDDNDSIFMNAETNNRLIDKYGKDDDKWIGKAVRLSCERDRVFNKLMLVLTPIA